MCYTQSIVINISGFYDPQTITVRFCNGVCFGNLSIPKHSKYIKAEFFCNLIKLFIAINHEGRVRWISKILLTTGMLYIVLHTINSRVLWLLPRIDYHAHGFNGYTSEAITSKINNAVNLYCPQIISCLGVFFGRKDILIQN